MSSRLFTPGPLCVSDGVRKAMNFDLGSRDAKFLETIVFIRKSLLDILHVNDTTHTSVLLQGAGSYAVEAVFANAIGKNDAKKALIIANGAYGERMGAMCTQANYNHEMLRFPEDNPLDIGAIEQHLKANANKYSLIATVHCETSTGNINDVHRIANVVQKCASNCRFFVDAMSSMGAIDVNMSTHKIDFVVSSANKCIQGVPGFAYVICNRDALKECEGQCRSWAFDLCAQVKGFETNGQFRCTPPTHTLLAFRQALSEFHTETRAGREHRYRENNECIRKAMNEMGFRVYDEHVKPEQRGFIITAFHYPTHANFNFEAFYTKLAERGQIIYPGKVSKADCFRLGNIGDLHLKDCQKLVQEVKHVLADLNIPVPLK